MGNMPATGSDQQAAVMMTVHKLSAGNGYTYLTQQVASADQRRVGRPLADYYTARGNPPGVWLGKGAEQLVVADGEVSEAQMRALFGQGLHPDAEAMLMAGAPNSATTLGAAYPTYGDRAPYPIVVLGSAARSPSQIASTEPPATAVPHSSTTPLQYRGQSQGVTGT